MPFTPAHVAAVLPWVGRGRPRWAVPAALVIGSMVPDVLYFVPISSHREFSHSLVGVVTLDLALGLLFLALWRVVAAPVVRDLAPAVVRGSIPSAGAPSRAQWIRAVPCVVLGALTHVAWDAFTHVDGAVVRRVPLLTAPVLAGLPAYKLAQYASGVLGVAVVAAYLVRRVGPAPAGTDDAAVATHRQRRAAWLVLVLTPVAVAVAFALPAVLSGTPVEMVLYVAVVRGISGLGLAATGVAVWWHRHRSRVLSAPTGIPPRGRATDRTR